MYFNLYSNPMREALSWPYSILKETESRGGQDLVQMSGKAGMWIQIVWLQRLFLHPSHNTSSHFISVYSFSSTTDILFVTIPAAALRLACPLQQYSTPSGVNLPHSSMSSGVWNWSDWLFHDNGPKDTWKEIREKLWEKSIDIFIYLPQQFHWAFAGYKTLF